jgi:hypothetical protein
MAHRPRCGLCLVWVAARGVPNVRPTIPTRTRVVDLPVPVVEE